MSGNKAAEYIWLAVAATVIVIHSGGIFLLIKLGKRKVSDNLLLFLSISETAKVLVRLGLVWFAGASPS